MTNATTPSATGAQVTLSQGTIHYRETGRGRPVVFVHGLLVDHTLWDGVVDALGTSVRCIAPDLPMGSHREAMNSGADLSPTGMARLIDEFLAALDLDDVTIVANDTGGAITQILITEHPGRVGRVVLTNCDAFENFLPPAFRPLQWLARIPGALTLALQPLRLAAIRRSPLGFGMLTRRRVPDAVLEGWSRPSLDDAGVRRDAIKLLRAISPRDTLRAAEKLRDFPGPAVLAWAPEDRFFKIAYAERLRSAFADGRLERIDDALTFVPLDQPQRVADAIAGLLAASAPASEQVGASRAE